MKNLNAEQIIKVLEHCSNWTAEKGCKGCPYDGNCIDEDVTRDALALITSQEQRIKELTEENERLRSQKYMLHSDGRIEPIPTIESVRADTIREMQKRLEDEDIIHNLTDGTNYYKYIPIEALDQIVKEMLEEVK